MCCLAGSLVKSELSQEIFDTSVSNLSHLNLNSKCYQQFKLLENVLSSTS